VEFQFDCASADAPMFYCIACGRTSTLSGFRLPRALGAVPEVVFEADAANFSVLRGFAGVCRAILAAAALVRYPVLGAAAGAAQTKPVASDDVLVIDQ
jgi:hypothetical protein